MVYPLKALINISKVLQLENPKAALGLTNLNGSCSTVDLSP
jgi:hypothetical protein